MSRAELPAVAVETGVVAVLRVAAAKDYEAVCRTLVDGGVRALELTLTTPDTIAALPALRAALPGACFGVGTVLTAADAEAAIAAGAEFLVTPGAFPEVAGVATAHGVPVIMGALTPTEVVTAWSMGAAAVKIFPAATVGPDYLRQLRGPFPDLLVMPSGGVALDSIGDWIRAGSVAVSLGGPLVGSPPGGSGDEDLRSRAARALMSVRMSRAA